MKNVVQFFANKFPTKYYLFWWLISFFTVIYFDVLWCLESSFVPMLTSRFLYVTAALIATIFSFPSVFFRQKYLQVVLLLLLDVMLEANIMYCRTYCMPIPLSSYSLISNLADFGGSIVDSFRWYDSILFLIVLIAPLIYPKTENSVRLKKQYYIFFLSFVLLIEYLMFLSTGGFVSNIRKCYDNANTAFMVVPNYSIFSFLIYDYIISDRGLDVDDEKNVDNWIENHNKYIAEYCEIAKAEKEVLPPVNLVFIVCESLESWPIELELEGKEITPFFNSLVRDSLNYYNSRVLSQVGGGRSIDCQLMTLAGLLPIERGSFSFKFYNSIKYSVPLALSINGLETSLLSCDNRYVWNQASVAEALGINGMYSREQWLTDYKGSVNSIDGNMNDGSLFEQAIKRFDNNEIWPVGSPMFSLWITRSGHNPFKIDEDMTVIDLQCDYPTILHDYITATAYVDSAVRILVQYLKSRDDWDNTVVVITGDHEGLATYRKDIVSDQRYDFVSENQFVPLIILNSPRIKGVDSKILGQIDIYSTLLDLMGLYDSYDWKGMGFSALDPSRPGIAVDSYGKVIGDTLNVDSRLISHIQESRKISDLIVRFNMMPQIVR